MNYDLKMGMMIKDSFVDYYNSNKNLLHTDIALINNIRELANNDFEKNGFPDISDEDWKYTDLLNVLKSDYIYQPVRDKKNIEFLDIFKCDVPQLDTIMIQLINGWFPADKDMIKEYDDGVIIGSFNYAQKYFPEFIEKHYAAYSNKQSNGLISLNTALANDGIFIYIPDNVKLKRAIQIVNIVYSNDNLNVFHRNLFKIGKNSSAKIVICDHSMFFNYSFVNSFTEVDAEENSDVELYKIQNYSNITSQYFATDIHQAKDSRVSANTYTLHGGFTRNDTKVFLNAEGSEINLNGLYLMDRMQHIDNNTYIEHKKPNTKSTEKYKGILDDDAKGVFSGKIYVDRDAQKTDAFQSNKNILLSDKAKIDTKPQLEIYADDVKCSHGATVGQLDTEAMFYLRSRGISMQESRMLLMYAFAHEIISEINVEPLRERMDDLISKRLRGEMSRCNHCTIRCS